MTKRSTKKRFKEYRGISYAESVERGLPTHAYELYEYTDKERERAEAARQGHVSGSLQLIMKHFGNPKDPSQQPEGGANSHDAESPRGHEKADDDQTDE